MELKHVPWDGQQPPTEDEAQARLLQEGFDSFVWNDVAGSNYPSHTHHHDECIWVISGKITFKIHDTEYPLEPGDRLYLPASTIHSASVPEEGPVSYLVGEPKSS